MGLNTCGRRLKIVGLLMHAVLLLGSLSMTAVGAWTGATGVVMEPVMNSNLYECSFILMVMGVVIVVIDVAGCVATRTENKCLSLVFIVSMFVSLVLVIAGIILTFVFRDQLPETAHNSMMASISQDYEERPDVRASWDALQHQLSCCGVKSLDGDPPYEAWRWSRHFMSSDQPPHVPGSCCLRTPGGDYIDRTDCLDQMPTNLSVYSQDCEEAAVEMIREQAFILGGVGIGVSCLMILTITLSCMIFGMIE